MPTHIIVRGARLHNLQNITVAIPRDSLVVLTGLSGSGKSTLGFDLLHKEGQRQYIESLGLVSFGLAKPPVDEISGLSPSISIDQHLTNHSPRSTVGTATDVYTYLRVLFARLGHRPCPHCGGNVTPSFNPTDPIWDAGAGVEEDGRSSTGSFPCPHCGAPVAALDMADFSFNKPEGACPHCTGLGLVHQADIPRLLDETRSLAAGAVFAWDGRLATYHSTTLRAASAHYRFDLDLDLPVAAWPPAGRDLLLYGVESPRFRRHYPDIEPPAAVRDGRFEGLATNLLRRYAERVQGQGDSDRLAELLVIETCPACAGTRLRPESRAVTVYGRTITDLATLSLIDLGEWLGELTAVLSPAAKQISAAVLDDLRRRITRLTAVGAGYLTCARASPSLSAGESQRLRLAALLDSALSGVLYVFDEPTIGLHQRDTTRLIGVLRRLRDLGNTVLVIEHDLDMIRAADHIIDFGPGAGKHGGRVVASGPPAAIAAAPDSLTGAYLAGRAAIPLPSRRRAPTQRALTIHGARAHNLGNITVSLPLGLFIAVTGISGSGKSTLVFDILDTAVRRRLYGAGQTPGEHDRIDGLEHIDKIVTINQAHLARVPRSNAATYTDTFTPIRQAFAATPLAQERGLTARHFSFNVPGGRCERCQGAGLLTVAMHFLPDVEVRCPTCHGRRFTRETLEIEYHGHDIARVLDLTIEEALALFADVPAARTRLQFLADVGLGYLQLGQPATTLSGGEAQRIKLAKELGRRASGHTLYLLDEPTTGLHLADTVHLLAVLNRLVDAGHTVVVVEHNLELVKTADWVIDLGPEGGAAGGRLLATGPPEHVAATPASHTGRALQPLL